MSVWGSMGMNRVSLLEMGIEGGGGVSLVVQTERMPDRFRPEIYFLRIV